MANNYICERMLIVSTMARNYNELEYLTRYVKAFEKNIRNDIYNQGISVREASPIMLERLYGMYNSLYLEMDDEIARKIFDQVHPGFISYVRKMEKSPDKKRSSFLKNLFVGPKDIDNTKLNQYNSYRKVDIER